MINLFTNKKSVESKPELDCYEDLRISLYRWSQYQSNGDSNWFIKDYDGRQAKIKSEYLDKLETKLNDDYYELVKDENYKLILEKKLKVSKLITRYTKIFTICNRIKQGFDIDNQSTRLDYILLLEKEGFKIPHINSEEGDIEECDAILYKCEQIKNQIVILNKDLEQKGAQTKTSIEKQLIQLCIGLETKIVSSREISVIQFVDMGNIMKDRHELIKQSIEKNKVK